mgnify:FL=1
MNPPKLSELIAKGSKLWPQAFKAWSTDSNDACALETAIRVLWPDSYKMHRDVGDLTTKLEIRDFKLECPICQNNRPRGVGSFLVHLNDSHSWPRERIADFLAKKGY